VALSKRRAAAVAKAVRAARPDLVLTVTGRGEAEPVEPNTQGGKDKPGGAQQEPAVEIKFAS
jgi:outer membrane protein OmpA-like peptidoglycan-associated protein